MYLGRVGEYITIPIDESVELDTTRETTARLVTKVPMMSPFPGIRLTNPGTVPTSNVWKTFTIKFEDAACQNSFIQRWMAAKQNRAATKVAEVVSDTGSASTAAKLKGTNKHLNSGGNLHGMDGGP
ncbi:hypothetical protein B0H67DRAFT_580112 [Lasiosphaeris hirsuta]|uniref:Uncharacterized protein n=1 Tax=Lasiosphaeris hirsuta TaxID=260670 RepID=A0AA40AFZ8_9PEZI|nr:hypothetical protein B0H67DRAFT_580112 [Lasiosphaeris hirsuta]